MKDYTDLSALKIGMEGRIRQRRAKMQLGGAVSLKSYLSVVNPELLNRIVGYTAEVIAEESKTGDLYLRLAIPLSDGTFYKLNVDYNNFDEGDRINISSIVVLFVDTPGGKTSLRCTGICSDENLSHVSQEAIREKIVQSYKNLVKEFNTHDRKKAETKPELPESFKAALENSAYRKRRTVSSRYSQYELECEWNQRKEYSEEENWYGLTDGMYGDYPDEGFDGDYEPIGY